MKRNDQNSQTKSKRRTYVLSSNYAAPQLFARGALFSPSLGVSTETQFLDTFGAEFPTAESTVPYAWTKGIEQSARNCFPILIEVERINDIPESEHSAKAGQAVCLSNVKSLIFRSEKERSRFSSWAFENYEINRPLEVRSRLFETLPEAVQRPMVERGEQSHDNKRGGGSKSNQLELRSDSPTDYGAASSSSIQIRMSGSTSKSPDRETSAANIWNLEAASAVLAATIHLAPGRRDWMNALAAYSVGTKPSQPGGALENCLETVRLGLEASNAFKPNLNDIESVLLLSATRVLLRYPMTVGWPSHEVLARIVEEAEPMILGKNDDLSLRKLRSWEKRATEVLGQAVQSVDLSDNPTSTARRAVMLVLMRGELAAVGRTRISMTGPVKVGQNVKILATCLCAIRLGLRGLPAEFKFLLPRDGEFLYDDPIEAFGQTLVESLQLSRTKSNSGVTHRLAVEYERVGHFEGTWKVVLCDRRVAIKKAQFNPSLERLFHTARHLGMEVAEDDQLEDMLLVRFSEFEQPVEVRVCVLEAKLLSLEMVRFWAIAKKGDVIDETGAPGKNRKAWKKDDFRRILTLNTRKDIHCRIGFDEESQDLIVLADQLMGTLDDKEFLLHVQNVAETKRMLTRS